MHVRGVRVCKGVRNGTVAACRRFKGKWSLAVPKRPDRARGDIVGWGTALQAGRSWFRIPMLSLEFFNDTILPAAKWPWGWLSLLTETRTRNISWEVKEAGAYG